MITNTDIRILLSLDQSPKSTTELFIETKIPVRTIQYSIKKLSNNKEVEIDRLEPSPFSRPEPFYKITETRRNTLRQVGLTQHLAASHNLSAGVDKNGFLEPSVKDDTESNEEVRMINKKNVDVQRVQGHSLKKPSEVRVLGNSKEAVAYRKEVYQKFMKSRKVIRGASPSVGSPSSSRVPSGTSEKTIKTNGSGVEPKARLQAAKPFPSVTDSNGHGTVPLAYDIIKKANGVHGSAAIEGAMVAERQFLKDKGLI